MRRHFSLLHADVMLLTDALLAWGRLGPINAAKIEFVRRRGSILLTDYNHKDLTF